MCVRLLALRVLAAALMTAVPCVSSAATVYFLVAEKQGASVHADSYVLPLSKPDDIAHARELIRNPWSTPGQIVVADIAWGGDGINGDYVLPGTHLWSWHVSQFKGFADFTMEILDGWPTDVEENPDFWFRDGVGHIGFWSYTVVRELAVVPEPSVAAGLALNLAGLGFFALRQSRAYSG